MAEWKYALYTNLDSASGRTDGAVIPWLQAVEKNGATIDSLGDGPDKFRRLDKKLATALEKLVTGNFRKSISLVQRTELTKHQKTLGGRQFLLLVYQHLATDSSMEHAFHIQDLMALEWLGDKLYEMEKFRNDWFCILNQMPDTETLNEETKLRIYVDQLDECERLKPCLAEYRRKHKIGDDDGYGY